MNNIIWEQLNSIETATHKLNGVACMLELIAEQVSDNAISGALWLCADVLKEKDEAINTNIGIALYENSHNIKKIEALEKAITKRKKK